MLRKDLKLNLVQVIKKSGFTLEDLTLEQCFSVFIEQYRDIRVGGTIIGSDIGSGQDTLFVSYGYSKGGSILEINIGRQCIVHDVVDELSMSHLMAKFTFSPTLVSDKMPFICDGETFIWCEGLSKVDDFRIEVDKNEIFAFCRTIQPISCEINSEVEHE